MSHVSVSELTHASHTFCWTQSEKLGIWWQVNRLPHFGTFSDVNPEEIFPFEGPANIFFWRCPFGYSHSGKVSTIIAPPVLGYECNFPLQQVLLDYCFWTGAAWNTMKHGNMKLHSWDKFDLKSEQIPATAAVFSQSKRVDFRMSVCKRMCKKQRKPANSKHSAGFLALDWSNSSKPVPRSKIRHLLWGSQRQCPAARLGMYKETSTFTTWSLYHWDLVGLLAPLLFRKPPKNRSKVDHWLGRQRLFFFVFFSHIVGLTAASLKPEIAKI